MRAKPKKPKITLAGSAGRFELGERIIDDPLEPGARLTAAVNVRECAIAHMASRGRLNSSQEAAGERFRKLWEQAAIGRSRAIDPAKEAVDGGTLGDPMTDDMVRAARELDRALKSVGMIASSILISVVGEGKRIEDAAADWSRQGGVLIGRRAEGYITGTMVDALNALVGHWRLEANGKANIVKGHYLRNGQKVEVDDDIVGSGPLAMTGPAKEITVGRFGDVEVRNLRPVDRGPMSAHVAGTVSPLARRGKK
jgi:hypothetical protein